MQVCIINVFYFDGGRDGSLVVEVQDYIDLEQRCLRILSRDAVSEVHAFNAWMSVVLFNGVKSKKQTIVKTKNNG
jgi:hypothetical protein